MVSDESICKFGRGGGCKKIILILRIMIFRYLKIEPPDWWSVLRFIPRIEKFAILYTNLIPKKYIFA